MRDLLNESSAWLARQQREYASCTVAYQRGDQVTELPASRTRFNAATDDNSGFLTRVEVWVFLIHADDLKLDNVPTTPAVGDRISEGPLGYEGIYEVMALPGESHWRWSDSKRNQYRIHAKKIEQK